MSYEVVFCDAIKKDIKHYKKHYPSVKDDVASAIRRLQEAPDLGDVMIGGKGARKLRVDNSDQNKGKSGSYRLIYYYINEPAKIIYLLTMFAKNEREDIPKTEVLRLLKAAGLR